MVTGLTMAVSGRHDAFILDVMLPSLDGFRLLETLRRTSQTAVIILTARDDVADPVKGPEGGADDYVAKAFAFSKLPARFRALMRRGAMKESTRYALADLRTCTST